jgi:hypothetical protein
MPGSNFVMDGYPTACALTRYIPRDHDSLARMKLMPASAFEPRVMYAHSALFRPEIAALLSHFHSLPKGCLISSAGGPGAKTAAVNCKREQHKGFSKSMLFDGVPYYVATRNIPRGEELRCPYNNTEERSGMWLPFQTAPSLSLASDNGQVRISRS